LSNYTHKKVKEDGMVHGWVNPIDSNQVVTGTGITVINP
jgi:hypothetical protein